MNRERCFDPKLVYRPEWPSKTPEGFTDETYIVPFSFLQVPATGRLVRGLPWSLDDDEPFIIQAIIFPQIGLSRAIDPTALPAGEGLCRIWDCMGNPLSQGLVLGLGMWGNASVGPVDAATAAVEFGFGWPLEDELVCPPGGVVLFDFQLSTNATVAFFVYAGVLETITFLAGVWGTAGNGRLISLIDPGAANVALSVAIVNVVDVEVTLATDGGGVVTSTFQDVADIINNTAALRGVMNAVLSGTDPNEVIAPMAAAFPALPFPVTVDADPNVELLESGGVDVFLPVVAGPYEIGGKRYILTRDINAAPAVIQMQVSSDDGQTWSAVAGPTVDITQYVFTTSVQVGTNIYVVYAGLPDVAGVFVNVVKFDTATDTFGVPVATTNSTGAFVGPVMSVGYDATNNQLVILNVGASRNIAAFDWTRLTYFTYDVLTDTFSGQTACGTDGALDDRNWFPLGVVSQAGTTVLLMYVDGENVPPTEIFQQSLVGGVLGVVTLVDSIADATLANSGQQIGLNVAFDGSTVVIAWGYIENSLGLPDAPIRVYVGAFAATIAFAAPQLITTPSAGGRKRRGVYPVIETGGDVVVLVSINLDPTTNCELYVYVDTGGGFDAGTLLGVYTASFGQAWIAASPLSTVWQVALAGTVLYWALGGGGGSALVGATASTPVDLYGSFIGVKRRREC